MPPPFNRRDSARFACGAVALLAALTGGVAWQTGRGVPATALAVLAASCAALALSMLLTQHLPPDAHLPRLTPAERRDATEPPPPGTARLRVALRREALAFYRMDLFVDGARVGQLRPGAALVVPLRPGPRVLSARIWLRRLDLRDQINALPGTDSDFVITGSGGRARTYGIDRHGLPVLLRDPRTVLVRPLVERA